LLKSAELLIIAVSGTKKMMRTCWLSILVHASRRGPCHLQSTHTPWMEECSACLVALYTLIHISSHR
jgi:hypothetical protein